VEVAVSVGVAVVVLVAVGVSVGDGVRVAVLVAVEVTVGDGVEVAVSVGWRVGTTAPASGTSVGSGVASSPPQPAATSRTIIQKRRYLRCLKVYSSEPDDRFRYCNQL